MCVHVCIVVYVPLIVHTWGDQRSTLGVLNGYPSSFLAGCPIEFGVYWFREMGQPVPRGYLSLTSKRQADKQPDQVSLEIPIQALMLVCRKFLYPQPLHLELLVKIKCVCVCSASQALSHDVRKINRVLLLTVNSAKSKGFSLTQRTKNWGILSFLRSFRRETVFFMVGGGCIWKQEDIFYHRLRFLWVVSGIANWCSKDFQGKETKQLLCKSKFGPW